MARMVSMDAPRGVKWRLYLLILISTIFYFRNHWYHIPGTGTYNALSTQKFFLELEKKLKKNRGHTSQKLALSQK